MLDTGIDVPEILNLVFFKIIRSRTKFWQMMGRGTRLCPDIFGPGQNKKCFYVFDYCQNLEFFNQSIDAAEAVLSKPLGQRLFITRLQLLGTLADNHAEKELVAETRAILQKEVAGMNLDNFVVHTKRQLVEKYAPADKWQNLSESDYEILAHEVSGLPSEIETDGEEAKRFDLIMLQLQMDLLNRNVRFATLMKKVKSIANLLEDKSAIPMVAEQLNLIQEIQTDEWWQDVTIQMLESVRKKLRLLIKLIEKREKKVIITDFEDQIGEATEVELDEVTNSSGDYEKFREKAKAYLRQHQDHITLHKLRMNQPLTAVDLKELERIFKENSLGSDEDLKQAAASANGLGLFVRSLIGLDRAAAKKEFEQFLNDKLYSANQISFVNMIVEHLTQNGVMDVGLLYEAPFTDVASQGPEGLFTNAELILLVSKIEHVRETALGA